MAETLRRRSPSEQAAWREGYHYGLKMGAGSEGDLRAALARSESEALHAHDVPGVGTLWWDASGKIVGGPEND